MIKFLGSALVIMAILEVDKSNKSYYGEQNLYLVAINGESCMVPLEKNGPVYSVKWNPNGKQFAVCYGYMPSRVIFMLQFFFLLQFVTWKLNSLSVKVCCN